MIFFLGQVSRICQPMVPEVVIKGNTFIDRRKWSPVEVVVLPHNLEHQVLTHPFMPIDTVNYHLRFHFAICQLGLRRALLGDVSSHEFGLSGKAISRLKVGWVRQ